jgi:hypothetical protein
MFRYTQRRPRQLYSAYGRIGTPKVQNADHWLLKWTCASLNLHVWLCVFIMLCCHERVKTLNQWKVGLRYLARWWCYFLMYSAFSNTVVHRMKCLKVCPKRGLEEMRKTLKYSSRISSLRRDSNQCLPIYAGEVLNPRPRHFYRKLRNVAFRRIVLCFVLFGVVSCYVLLRHVWWSVSLGVECRKESRPECKPTIHIRWMASKNVWCLLRLRAKHKIGFTVSIASYCTDLKLLWILNRFSW